MYHAVAPPDFASGAPEMRRFSGDFDAKHGRQMTRPESSER
jgi:hypothetical protein